MAIADGFEPGAREHADPRDFSIVLGGPLYQLMRRAHMSGGALELVQRRILSLALVTWLPLAVLSMAGGDAFGGAARVPFVKDIEVHARFLLALPLLVAAELLVHQRLRPIAQEFVVRGLVPEESLAAFRACVISSWRLRNSVLAEVLMLALVFGVGIPFLWRYTHELGTATWYAVPGVDGTRLTPAGWWYAFVSVPVFQFLLLRWYFRIAIWIRFLWKVSRIRLALSPVHGDLNAGMGFLGGTVYAFVPLLVAHGVLLSGNIANRVLYGGAKLADSYAEVALVAAFLFALVVLPLTVFAGQVNDTKRRASREYGRLAQRYARDFEAKWLPGGTPPRQSPLGDADIQSLADLANSLAVVRATGPVPITRQVAINLAAAILVPLAPLLLTVVPARELAAHLVKLLL
jgi:hypothetical protein